MNKETKENIFYVYLHTFASGAVYVGKGKDKRAYSFSRRSSIWSSHRNKYSTPTIEILSSKLEESQAFLLEVEKIKHYKELGTKILNLTIGGEGVSGYIASDDLINRRNEAIKKAHNSEEVKIKVSIASKLAHSNPETKEKHRRSLKLANSTDEMKALRSKHAKGRQQSDTTKAKRSISMTGRKLSSSHIANMSGENHHSIDKREYSYYHDTIGEVTATQSFMLKEYKCKASHLISGRIKTSRGWKLL